MGIYNTIDNSILDKELVSEFCDIHATAMLGFYERFGNTGGFVPIRSYQKVNGHIVKGIEVAVRETISEKKKLSIIDELGRMGYGDVKFSNASDSEIKRVLKTVYNVHV
jgi:hypothetical protein